jgi:protein-S-isoprenylcysteine O-methyltransferase Ste14
MSRRQFGFLIGFAVAVTWALVGFLAALAAVVAGCVGYVVVRALDGEFDVRQAVEHLTPTRR